MDISERTVCIVKNNLHKYVIYKKKINMIKKFENFINEAKMTGNKRFKDETNLKRCIGDFIRWFQVDAYKIFRDVLSRDLRFTDLRKAYMEDDIESAITFLASLKFNMLKDGDDRYNEYIDLITHILELADFDETELSPYDEFKYANDENISNIDGEKDDDIIFRKKEDAVAHSKFDFIKKVVREYFEEYFDNKKIDLPGLSEEEIKNGYNSEIKQIRRYFGTTLDFNHDICMALEDRMRLSDYINHGFYYTLEEIKSIHDEIKRVCGDKVMPAAFKFILDLNNKRDIMSFAPSYKRNKLNFVVAENGKVLTDEAYYNPIFDMFTETEEQMEYLIGLFYKSDVYKTLSDYFENLPDVSKYELVDLKKMNRG